MKLVLFPGAGNPDAPEYSNLNALIQETALEEGFSGVDCTVRWPGQYPGGQVPADSPSLDLQSATTVASDVLRRYEEAREPYAIWTRSFGAQVTLSAIGFRKLQFLRQIYIWGPPCFTRMWELFNRDLAVNIEKGKIKQVQLSKAFFPSLIPIEALLPQCSVASIMAIGDQDDYCSPAYFEYLRSLLRKNPAVHFMMPFANVTHEMRERLPSGEFSPPSKSCIQALMRCKPEPAVTSISSGQNDADPITVVSRSVALS